MFKKIFLQTARVVAVLIFTLIGNSQLTAQCNQPPCGCEIDIHYTITYQSNGCNGATGNTVTVTANTPAGWDMPDTLRFGWSSFGYSGQSVMTTTNVWTWENLPAGVSIRLWVSSNDSENGCHSEAYCIVVYGGLNVAAWDNRIECGETTAWIGADAYGGTPDYNYVWRKDSLTGPIVSYEQYWQAPNGVYFVIVTDAFGCTAIGQVYIEAAPQTPTATVMTTNGTCQDDNGTATALGNGVNLSYKWSNGKRTQTITSLTPGVYTVTVTDNLTGCTTTATGTIVNSGVSTDTTIYLSDCGLVELPWNDSLVGPGIYTYTSFVNPCGQNITAFVTSTQSQDEVIEVIEACNSWTQGDTTLHESGYVVNSFSIDSCETRQITFVNIQKSKVINLSTNFCEGSTKHLMYNGVAYHNDTTFTVSNEVCHDSVKIVFNELAGPLNVQLADTTICVAPFQSTNTTQSVVNILYNSLGCDSIRFWRNITYLPSQISASNVEICEGDTFLWAINGQLYSQGGVYTYVDYNGICPIWYQLSIFVKSPGTVYQLAETCDPMEAGLTMIPGLYPCNPDTVRFTQLLGIVAIETRDTTVCFGDPLTGPLIDTIEVNGCLVQVITNVNQQENTIGHTTESLCRGDTLVWNGIVIVQQGTYSTVTGSNQSGCDSITMLHITMIQGHSIPSTKDTCNFAVIGQTETSYAVNPNGCTDTLITTLTWKPGFYQAIQIDTCVANLTNIRDTIQIDNCFGIHDTIFRFTPHMIDSIQWSCIAANDTTLTVVDSLGCTTLIKVCHRTYPVAVNYEYQEHCINDFPFTWNGVEISEPDQYSVTLEGASVNGCDSTIILNVFSLPIASDTLRVNVCEGSYYEYQGILLAEGEHEFPYLTTTGCDSIVTVIVQTYDWESILTIPGDSTLTAPVGMTIQQAAQWVYSIAALGTITVTNNDILIHVKQFLEVINDSTYRQNFIVVTPCDTFESFRMIYINFAVIPKPICQVQIIRGGDNEVTIIVTPLNGEVITDIRYQISAPPHSAIPGSLATGNLHVGINTVPLPPVNGTYLTLYYLQIWGEINGIESKVEDSDGDDVWCIK